MSAQTIEVKRKNGETEYPWSFEVKPLKVKTGEPAKFAYVPKKPTTPEEEAAYVNFIGQKDLVAMAGRLHRQWSVNWSKSASTKTAGQPMESEVYQTTFTQLASEMSAEGLSLKALKAEENELKAELFAILGNKSLNSTQKEEQMLTVASRMKEIEATIEARNASKTDDDDAEVDTNATSEATPVKA